jgi:adenylosuccinate synthase
MYTRSARAIIGANFGDEGKGVLTDYFAAQAPATSLIVRFNGGAQAGHTVVTPDGQRHVFGHVGAGSFCGAPTFLSSYFVCNPLLFLREHEALGRLGLTPTVWVDPRAPVTTPYDMLINQLIEDARGSARHGSCGVGFGETWERSLSPDFALTVADLADHSRLPDRLADIRRRYVPERLARLDLHDVESGSRDLMQSDSLIGAFVTAASRFLEAIEIRDGAAITGHELIFEGAQGLLLDQDRGWFPHVTRSHTGLHNVLRLATDLGIDHLDATYVTRAYVTRHGAGPLPRETSTPPYAGIVDPTNLPHPYQGTLRFGLLDLDLLAQSVATDAGDAVAAGIGHRVSLAVTCLDQLAGQPARYVEHGSVQETSITVFLERAVAAAQAEGLYAVAGASRCNIRADLRTKVAPGGDRISFSHPSVHDREANLAASGLSSVATHRRPLPRHLVSAISPSASSRVSPYHAMP